MRPKAIKVKDLPEHGNGHGMLLYCPHCGGEYSPDRGDYFLANPETVLRCCRRLLRLVRKRTRYEEIDTKTVHPVLRGEC